MASRDISDCVPGLQTAWAHSLSEWKQTYPDRPVPFLTCTHRDNEEQEILYMRDKNHLDDDGDGQVDEKDEWRSNAKPGQSKHNDYPSKALDVAFKDAAGKLHWDEYLFSDFAVIMKRNGANWGGDWVKLRKSRKNDTPHFDVV